MQCLNYIIFFRWTACTPIPSLPTLHTPHTVGPTAIYNRTSPYTHPILLYISHSLHLYSLHLTLPTPLLTTSHIAYITTHYISHCLHLYSLHLTLPTPLLTTSHIPYTSTHYISHSLHLYSLHLTLPTPLLTTSHIAYTPTHYISHSLHLYPLHLTFPTTWTLPTPLLTTSRITYTSTHYISHCLQLEHSPHLILLVPHAYKLSFSFPPSTIPQIGFTSTMLYTLLIRPRYWCYLTKITYKHA